MSALLRTKIKAIVVLVGNWRIVHQNIVGNLEFCDVSSGHVACVFTIFLAHEFVVEAAGAEVGDAWHGAKWSESLLDAGEGSDFVGLGAFDLCFLDGLGFLLLALLFDECPQLHLFGRIHHRLGHAEADQCHLLSHLLVPDSVLHSQVNHLLLVAITISFQSAEERFSL